MTDRPVCPVCLRPVQYEVVNFLGRQVQQRIYQCGAIERPDNGWVHACPAAMAEYIAAEREIKRLRAELSRVVTP